MPAQTIAKNILELIIGVMFLAIGLPIAVGFIIATNTTGWGAILVSLWTVGMPSLVVIIGVYMLMEALMKHPK